MKAFWFLKDQDIKFVGNDCLSKTQRSANLLGSIERDSCPALKGEENLSADIWIEAPASDGGNSDRLKVAKFLDR